MPYAILLNELKEFDFEKVARILAKADSIIYADATFRLRHSFGILADKLPYEEVQMITTELNNISVGCFHMDMNDLYRPPDPFTVNSIYCGDDFFGGIDMYGNIQPYFWPNIVLLSCGHITEEKVHKETKPSARRPIHFTVTGSVVGAIKQHIDPAKEKTRRVERISRWFFDIFVKQPQEKHLRIASNSFNYDCLGDRILPVSRQNFRLVVQDICQYAKSAFSNRGLRAFLEKPPRTIEYKSLKHFDAENLWLLQLTYLNLKSNQ